MPVPFGFLNVSFRHYSAARTVESRAVNQTGLKGLELLTSNDVIVNIDNHGDVLSVGLSLPYQRLATRGKPLNWSTGVVE
jgi:hypothetical protein